MRTTAFSALSAHSDSKRCVLLFSGGRDSTIAALKLSEQGYNLVLVTITATFLAHIENVRARLAEMAHLLPPSTVWVRIQQPGGPSGAGEIPAFHAHCASQIAARTGTKCIAFGYSDYQRDWVEQTESAISALTSELGKAELSLLLPVRYLQSKSHAMTTLAAYGLSPGSLEQKLVGALPEDALCGHEAAPPVSNDEAIVRWRVALSALSEEQDELDVRANMLLGGGE